MKKILKYDSVIVLFIFVSLMIVPTFLKQLYINDELWNFTNVYKMYNGYKIYKECNVIVTPLFFYIGEFLFWILSPNMFVFRIYNVIINALLFFLVYKLNLLIGISKRRSLLYTLVLTLFVSTLNNYGANYNCLAYIFVIYGLICNIKQKNNILNGLILFLIFMTKQNVGIYYFIGICMYYLWERKYLKKNINKLIIQFIVAGMCFGFYCLYLYYDKNLSNFFDLTFLGLSEFSMNNLFFSGQAVCVILVELMIFIFSFFIIISKKVNLSDDIRNKLKLILCIAIPLCAMEYPLFNDAHLVLGAFFCMICLIYVFDKTIINEIAIKNKFINISIVSIIIILNYINIHNIIYYNSR